MGEDLMQQQLNRMERKIDLIEKHITGGSRPEHGLIVKTDRLEQAHKRQVWWMRAIGTAAVASLFAWLRNMVNHL